METAKVYLVYEQCEECYNNEYDDIGNVIINYTTRFRAFSSMEDAKKAGIGEWEKVKNRDQDSGKWRTKTRIVEGNDTTGYSFAFIIEIMIELDLN